MFDFFEGLIQNLGLKLITNFSEKIYEFIKETKEKSKGNYNDNEGDSAKIGSSGDSARIGSSGYSAKIGSSGDSARIGSSGYSARIGSSGYSAKIGSSGDFAQIGSSGDFAKIGSSGYSTRICISGDYSIGFACGYQTIIRAKKGTWISLAEYGKNNENNIIPIYAKSAQIGNKEYKDFKGNILKENTYYILFRNEFYPVEEYDGLYTIKLSEKKRENISIIKGIDIDDILDNEIEEIYIAKEGELSAHGNTIKEAINDLMFKKMKEIDTQEIIKEIKETGKVTRGQYRVITGACSYGTNKFCEEHKIENLEEIELKELRKILIDDYGAKKFWYLIDKGE